MCDLADHLHRLGLVARAGERLAPRRRQISQTHCRHLDVQVDAVEQRSGHPRAIALDERRVPLERARRGGRGEPQVAVDRGRDDLGEAARAVEWRAVVAGRKAKKPASKPASLLKMKRR